MTLQQLRLKHPRLVYKQVHVERSAHAVTISHEFLLEPDILFRPSVVIPRPPSLRSGVSGQARPPEASTADLNAYAFNLGMVEAISYWKCACPPELVVEAGSLTQEQMRFWKDVFLHGLGEFFYRNEIDFIRKGFLEMKSQGVYEYWGNTGDMGNANGDLVLVGGGKDSAVTLGILNHSDRRIRAMVVNPTQAALDTIRAAGLSDPIVVNRTIDPKLLELNSNGYLNGHTPFSAYLAFLGVTVAALYGYENVIVSNEKSANEGNVVYRGLEVNHQYSKSFAFEEAFRAYADDALNGAPSYFSLLRPLNDLSIGALFSRYPEFFAVFRSCNVGSRTNRWCGSCPKCAFTYLMLSPFLPPEQLFAIFGGDLFQNGSVLEHIRALTGLTEIKPFECVGTRDESRLAVVLAIDTYVRKRHDIPEGLLKIKSDLNLSSSDVALLRKSVLEQMGATYNVPSEHMSSLKKAWEGIQAAIGEL